METDRRKRQLVLMTLTAAATSSLPISYLSLGSAFPLLVASFGKFGLTYSCAHQPSETVCKYQSCMGFVTSNTHSENGTSFSFAALSAERALSAGFEERCSESRYLFHAIARILKYM